MERIIKIIDSNTTNGRLTLSYDSDNLNNSKNGDDIKAYALDRIVWEIIDEKVYSYRIEPKAGSENIWHFWNHPPKYQTRDRRGSGGVGLFAAGKVYKYNIFWKTSAESAEYKYDPIISIKPHASWGLFSKGVFLPGIVGLSSLIHWRMKRMRKNRP